MAGESGGARGEKGKGKINASTGVNFSPLIQYTRCYRAKTKKKLHILHKSNLLVLCCLCPHEHVQGKLRNRFAFYAPFEILHLLNLLKVRDNMHT